MEQNKLVLEGQKRLKWEAREIKSIQDDEIIINCRCNKYWSRVTAI